jgi:hypothetical protein
LLTRTDNPRRALADQSVPRGALLDRQNNPLVETSGTTGDFTRTVHIPQLGPMLGYNHPIYGQAGLEASLDPILRGQEGNDPWLIWQHHLLYGMPPPGLDVRLTLDINLQKRADALLGDQAGALVLLNAESGEILALASHPTYDPSQLDDTWDALIQDDRAPLLNRATQGRYPSGDLGLILFPSVAPASWLETVPLRLPGGEPPLSEQATSPMSVALLAAAFGNNGLSPAPRLAQAYLHPDDGWRLLPPLGTARQLSSRIDTGPFQDSETTWSLIQVPEDEEITWYLAGTLGTVQGQRLAIVVVLETVDADLATQIGQTLLAEALLP